jgi:hypothetical protein
MMTFPQALFKMMEGKSVRRPDWPEGDAGYIAPDGILMVYRDKKDFQWIVHKNDIIAVDWVVINKTN